MGGTPVERYACRWAPRRVCANRAQMRGQRRAGRACRHRRLHQICRALVCDSGARARSPRASGTCDAGACPGERRHCHLG